MKVNSEMNTKYNSYDHLDKLKCVENDEIINIEKKFEAFSIDINYDYAKIMLENKEVLPNVNIDLSKVIAFYKSRNDSLDDLVKEITLFNKYYESLTKWVNLTKTESLKEKSIVYYLFYFMSRCFIYIVMHNNFMVSKPNTIIFLNFFNNYIQIINTAKLYLENDIENSSIIIEEEDKETTETKIKTNVNKGLYAAFAELKKYPEEFKDMIMRCHNFLALVLFSIDQSVPPENEEDANWVSDFTIKNGNAKVIEVYDENDNLLNPDEYIGQGADEYGLNKGFGWVKVMPGSRVIFEFVPDYGYQLTEIAINETPLEAIDTSINRYEIDLPNEDAGNLHFAATFTKTDDIVKPESKKVKSGH